jgi:hypothetical protein
MRFTFLQLQHGPQQLRLAGVKAPPLALRRAIVRRRLAGDGRRRSPHLGRGV